MLGIVIANWNGEKLIDECLKSLENQSFKAFKLYIIDNNSKDKSKEVIKRYNEKLNIDFSEVTIKRRAYRNGESGFFLNDKACRLKDINIQAWSPYQYGFFEGTFIDNPKFPVLNKKLNELAEKIENQE